MTPERSKLLSEYERRVRRERDMSIRPPLTRGRTIDQTQMQQLVYRQARQVTILSSDVGFHGVAIGDVGAHRFTPGYSAADGTDFVPDD